jgi:hypothetical protein
MVPSQDFAQRRPGWRTLAVLPEHNAMVPVSIDLGPSKSKLTRISDVPALSCSKREAMT